MQHFSNCHFLNILFNHLYLWEQNYLYITITQFHPIKNWLKSRKIIFHIVSGAKTTVIKCRSQYNTQWYIRHKGGGGGKIGRGRQDRGDVRTEGDQSYFESLPQNAYTTSFSQKLHVHSPGDNAEIIHTWHLSVSSDSKLSLECHYLVNSSCIREGRKWVGALQRD